MAIPILVPRLGWTMEEGVFEGWLKQDGDSVQAGDLLFSLEGEKASQDIEAIDGGVLRIPPNAPKPGDVVPVGGLLAYLLAPGEPPPWETDTRPPDAGFVATSGTTVKLSAASPRPAAPHQPSDEHAAPGLPTRHAHEPTISPRARRIAQELGVDWTSIRGSGRTGRIRERDVRAAATGATRPRHDAVELPTGRIVPLTPTRKLIAQRMAASAHSTAPVTLTTKADATNLVNLRNQFQSAASGPAGFEPSYTDLVVKLVALALEEHPPLNALWQEDHLIIPDGIHIAIAVDTQSGLVAPVIRDVSSLSLRQLAACSRDLIDRARSRKLSASDLQGGTFTVTNLGMYSIDAFTPIIHTPQCAILGLGRIVREPAVHNEQIVPRDMLTLSLTFDHRIIDGAPAARFLDTLRRSIEQPGACLLQ